MTDSRSPSRRLPLLIPRSWLDYLIVALLLLTPQSLFAAYATSLAPFWLQKIVLYSAPAVLLTLRALLRGSGLRRHLFGRFLKYFVFVAFGLVLALSRTESPRGVINSYGAVLLYMGYTALYLSTSREDALYHINLIRLLYVHIAILGLVHYISWGFLGIHATVFDCYAYADGASVPFSGLTLVYSTSPWFPHGVPRYGFVLMEPRVLGSQLPVAMLIQYGYMRYAAGARNRRARMWARLQLTAIVACLLITHSATGYTIFAALLVFVATLIALGSSRPALRVALAGGFALYCAIGALSFALFFQQGFVADDLNERIFARLGPLASALSEGNNNLLGRKDPGIVLGYSRAMLTYPFNLFHFPFGSGWLQPEDQLRYDRYGITVTGGFSFVAALVVHAGFIGLIAFVYAALRVIRAAKPSGQPRDQPVRWFAISALFLFLAGLVVDTTGLTAGLFLRLFVIELVLDERLSARATPPLAPQLAA